MVRSLVIAVAILGGTLGVSWALHVEPARQEYVLAPGSSKRAEIEVMNDGQQPLHIEVSEKTWFTLEENKQFPVDSWMEIHGDKSFVLKPGERRKVKLTLKCPKGAQGELVGMASFLYVAQEDQMVTPIISVSVYVAVKGTERSEGEITDLVVREWQGKIQMGVEVKSTGNVSLRPSGRISIVDAAGHEVSSQPVLESGPAYPGRVEPYVVADPNLKLKAGRYQARAQLVTRGVMMTATRDFDVADDGKITLTPK